MHAYELCTFSRTVAVVRHMYARTMVLYPSSTALAMHHICTTYTPYIHTVGMYEGSICIENCPRTHTNSQSSTHKFTAPNRQTRRRTKQKNTQRQTFTPMCPHDLTCACDILPSEINGGQRDKAAGPIRMCILILNRGYGGGGGRDRHRDRGDRI